MKAGELTHADFKRVRNYKFHKKYFALLDFAFEQWEPSGELTYQGMPVAKRALPEGPNHPCRLLRIDSELAKRGQAGGEEHQLRPDG
jgi:hypothetical protein